jgi:hypothetical protein
MYINCTHDNTLKSIRKKFADTNSILVMDRVDNLLVNDVSAVHTLAAMRNEDYSLPFVLISEHMNEELYLRDSLVDSVFQPVKYKVPVFSGPELREITRTHITNPPYFFDELFSLVYQTMV